MNLTERAKWDSMNSEPWEQVWDKIIDWGQHQALFAAVRAQKPSAQEEMESPLPALVEQHLDQLRMQNSWNF